MNIHTFDGPGLLSYYVNQLEQLDKRLYLPLFSTTWGRDIKLRSDVSFANESTSYILSKFGVTGSQSVGGKPWISPKTKVLAGVSMDGEKIVAAMRLLGMEISYTSVELERSQTLNQPLDKQLFEGLNMFYQMGTDEMVYLGDKDVGATGLLNDLKVSRADVKTGAGGKTEWESKTPDEILDDIDTACDAAWKASGYKICPQDLLVPPVKFSLINRKKMGTGETGTISLLRYLSENSLCNAINGKPLNIRPVKWLSKDLNKTLGKDRMVPYSNEEEFVRFPMVPIRREQPYYQGITFSAPYIWAYGEVEIPRLETISYRDGI